MTATATAKATATSTIPADPGASASMARLVLQQITTSQATGGTGAGGSGAGGSGAGGGAPPAINDAPLFEVKLELTETEIRFSPAFDASVENNFQQIVEQLLLDIKQTCDCMPRIVADNALSEDDEDDTATVEFEQEQEQKQEPKWVEDQGQELAGQEPEEPKPQAVQFNLLAAAKAYSQKMECSGMDFASPISYSILRYPFVWSKVCKGLKVLKILFYFSMNSKIFRCTNIL